MRAEARRGKNGERKTRARGLPPLEAETRGKLENVGAGASAWAVAAEREDSGATVGGRRWS